MSFNWWRLVRGILSSGGHDSLPCTVSALFLYQQGRELLVKPRVDAMNNRGYEALIATENQIVETRSF